MRINKLLLLFLLVSSGSSFCQGLEPEMQVNPENKELIIELMEVNKFETYFVQYCTNRIESIGKEKGLDKDLIALYKKNIDYKTFLDYTVFNQFAIYSSEELKQMISLCKTLNKNKKFNQVFFSTPGLESNLELMIRQYMMNEK